MRGRGVTAREGAQRVAAGGGGLVHANAAQATGLVDPGTGGDQVEGGAGTQQVLQHLAGAGVDVEAQSGGGLTPVEHGRSGGVVAHARLGGGAEHHLADRGARRLADRDDVAGRAGPGDQRLQGGEFDPVGEVVAAARFGRDPAEVLLTAPGHGGHRVRRACSHSWQRRSASRGGYHGSPGRVGR